MKTSRHTIEDDLEEFFLQAYNAISYCSQNGRISSNDNDTIPDLSAIVGTADDFVQKSMAMLDAEFYTYTLRPRTKVSSLGNMLFGLMQRRMLDVIEVYINYIIYRLLPPEEVNRFLLNLRPYTRKRLDREEDRIYMDNVLENNPPGNFWELVQD